MNTNEKERFRQRVQTLENFGHRGSGTDAEDRAANYLIDELRASGINTEKELFHSSNSLATRVLVHVIIAVIGLAFFWVIPLLTACTGLAVLASITAESTTRFKLLSRLVPKARSRNVVGRIRPQKCNPHLHRLILCAHIDTQRTGLMWRDKVARRFITLSYKVRGPLKSPSFLVMSAFTIQTLFGLTLLVWPNVLVTIPTVSVLLLLYGFNGTLLVDWSFGEYTPGACDNATGIAATLALAERWAKEPIDNVELVILLSGCEEIGALGAAAWLDRHKSELKNDSCSFLVFDLLGYGLPRFLKREYSLAALPVCYPREIIRLCKNVAHHIGLNEAGPHSLMTGSDAVAFLNRGIPGATILTFEDGGYVPNYHQMTDTSARLDFETVWSATEFGWEVLKELALHSNGLKEK